MFLVHLSFWGLRVYTHNNIFPLIRRYYMEVGKLFQTLDIGNLICILFPIILCDQY